MNDFSVVGLRVLCEVAARGSFTAAADSLGYTQSAISRQVAALEVVAGVRLFERASRGVVLTDAGSVLLRHATGVIDRLDVAKRELSGVGAGASGRLRVGAFPTALAALLPRALAAYRAGHAGVRVSLREGTTPTQLRQLASGASELAVVGLKAGQPPGDERVAFESLLEDPLLLAVATGHRLARQRTVDLDDLAGEHWIAGSSNADDTLLGVWPSLSWRPHVAFIAREWTAKLGLVAAGLGVTVLPGLAAVAVRKDVALVRVRGTQPAVRAIALATPAGSELPAHVRALADALQDVAGEIAIELQQRVQDRAPARRLTKRVVRG
jgi:DNA-binding transcriptional LysR family regulator